MRRRALLVLGMHRSGTSALAGTLIQLGAQGPSTLMRPTDENPRGYWESQLFCEFHDRLLESAGTRWDAWTRFSPGWLDSPTAAQFVREFRLLLRHEFDNAPLFVAKDPRICRFVPFWLRNLRAEGIVPAAVIPLRSPLDVARSIEVRRGLGPRRSLLLWLRHVLDAEVATREIERSIVRYRDLLEDWQAVALKISRETGAKWPVDPATAQAGMTEFLSIELCHHAIEIEALDGPFPLVEWITRTWRALDVLVDAAPRQVDEALRTLDQVRSEFDQVASIFGPVVEEEERQAREQLSRVSAEHISRVEADHHQAEEQLRHDLGSRRLEAEALDGQLAAERREVDALRTAIATGQLDNERLRGEADAAGAELRHHRAGLASLQVNLEQARAESDAAEERLEAATSELVHTRHRVEDLIASGSWRVTAPLRAVLRLLTRRQ